MQQIQYVATSVDGRVMRRESLTDVVSAIADADGVDRFSISTRQVAADQWHVYGSPEDLDRDPNGDYWIATISVEVVQG